MAKVSNESKLVDAKLALDRLYAIPDLNKSSRSMLSVIESSLEMEDGHFAFTVASRAEYMHIFCTEVAGK